MALTNEERQIVQFGKNEKKSTVEIMQALANFRSQRGLQERSPGAKGVGGFALGAAKEVVGGLQELGKLPLRGVAALMPGLNQKDVDRSGISEETLEPKSEAERAGAKTAFVGSLASGGAGLIRAGLRKGSKLLGRQQGKVAEQLQPKLNAKETRRAIEEGRVTQGRSNPLTGKTKDVVIPDAKVRRASEVVLRDIPKATTRNSFELADDIGVSITKKAQTLKPQMQSVNLTDDTKSILIDEWGALQKLQKESDLFADALTSNTKFQNRFETFLDEAVDAKNLDELWDIRKRYDRSITSSIKKANQNSPTTTQIKNEMWLQNRSILNDVIEDVSTGLGNTAKNSFDDMSSLYTARTNIINREKIDLKGTSGIINKKNIIRALIGTGAGVVGINQIL